jgi:hypothetical protein
MIQTKLKILAMTREKGLSIVELFLLAILKTAIDLKYRFAKRRILDMLEYRYRAMQTLIRFVLNRKKKEKVRDNFIKVMREKRQFR